MPPPPSRRTGTDDDGRILTAVDVERMIEETSAAMKALREEVDAKADAAARAEHAWKVARAKSRTRQRAMGGDGPGGRATNDECDDYALEQHEEEHLEYLLTSSAFEASKAATKLVTSQMDGLRTIAANIRGQT